ncbi:MAG: hypothetical protein ACHQ49_00805 [Elusimicrobiota bacterium]
MIQGRFWTELLARGANATRGRRLAPLHAAMRWLCLNAAVPAVQFAFRHGRGLARTTLIARNSVLEEGGFHFLESDVDLTLVFEGAADAAAVANARAIHARLRGILPFLGELEIYERREVRLKEQLAAGSEPLLRAVWLLRKWRWQYARLAAAPSRYHRTKAERSIRKIQERLGLPPVDLFPRGRAGRLVGTLIEELTRDLRGEETGPAVNARRGFLEWEIRSGEPKSAEGDGFVLYCSRGAGLALLAALPDGAEICPETLEDLEALRRSPPVREKLIAISISEWTLLRSVARTSAVPATEDPEPWARHLERILLEPPALPLMAEFPELTGRGSSGVLGGAVMPPMELEERH